MYLEQFYNVLERDSNIPREVAEAMTLKEAIEFCKKEYGKNLIIFIEKNY